MAAFSRLQLATALIEYDNDETNPNAPRRSAQDSAIFAHMRRARSSPAARKSTDYLSVALPGENQNTGARGSTQDSRKSRASTVNALRNPFGPDEYDEESLDGLEETEEMEVDLASWGLDAFKSSTEEKAPKSKKPRGRTKSETLDRASLEAGQLRSSASVRARSMSVGGLGGFGLGGAFLDATTTERPHSVASPLDLAGMTPPTRPPHLRRKSDHSLIDNIASAAPLHAVPFPREASPRPLSSDLEGATHQRTFSAGSGSMLAYDQPAARPKSSASFGSRLLQDEDPDSNIFSVPAPAADRASRFDPKAQRERERKLSVSSRNMLGEDAEFRPVSAHLEAMAQERQRAHSNASMGSQLAIEPRPQERRQRRYSKMDLMRPKVLIMPSPLQEAGSHVPPPQPSRDGFQLTTDGPPLPANARTTRRASATMSTLLPSSTDVGFGSSTSGLSLSQMTFRNTLAVDGQNQAFLGGPPIATEDGQQIEFPEPEQPIPGPVIAVDAAEPEPAKRPAGKLYGRSLIDNLEARKAEMRGKQRAYRGGDRPAMMSRSTDPRSSTLIDTTGLQPPRPVSQRLDSLTSAKTAPNMGGIPQSRSVFGTDTLWEREMQKLRAMQAEEEAERLRNEGQDPSRPPLSPSKDVSPQLSPSLPTHSQVGTLPVLPAVQRVTVRQAPRNDDSDDEDSEDDNEPPTAPAANDAGWDSDDEDGIRQRRAPPSAPLAGHQADQDEDSEEDLPLAATVGRAAQRLATTSRDDDSDEEKPLSTLLQRTQLGIPNIDFDRPKPVAEDDEDDKPLAFRASSFMGSTSVSQAGPVLDDDAPLGMHPDQQSRAQYQMFAAAQAQQQQMMMQAQMMQAQMHNSMYFGAPSVMGSAFLPPVMGPPMMMAPPQVPSPPPMPDPANFSRVDRWRQDVAVEGAPK